MDTEFVLCIFAIILVLIGIIGGGFQIKEIIIPKVRMPGRIAAGVLGSFIMVFSISEIFVESTVGERILSIENPAKTQKVLTKAEIEKAQREGQEIGDVGCILEPTLKSINGGIETFVDFRNNSSQPVEIFWLNYSGERVKYSNLQPDKSYTQQTYLSHPWMVTNQLGKCLKIYFPTKKKGFVNIKD